MKSSTRTPEIAKAPKTSGPTVGSANNQSPESVQRVLTDFERRLTETERHLDAITALWTPLVQLTDDERNQGMGKVIFTMGPAIKTLLNILVPKPAWTDDDRKLAANFDHLGDRDGGVDPERFEPIPLLGLFERIEKLAEIRKQFSALDRKLGDDLIHHGQTLSTVGMLALGHARSLSEGNATFRSKLAPVLNLLSQMTRDARKAAADAKTAVPTPEADSTAVSKPDGKNTR